MLLWSTWEAKGIKSQMKLHNGELNSLVRKAPAASEITLEMPFRRAENRIKSAFVKPQLIAGEKP